MRIAVSGANSGIGRTLLSLEASQGCRLFAMPPRRELDLLREPDKLTAWLDQVQPDALIHLAGAKPPASAHEFMQGNVLTTLALFEAIERHALRLENEQPRHAIGRKGQRREIEDLLALL